MSGDTTVIAGFEGSTWLSETADADRIPHPDMRLVYEYWLSRRTGSGDVPARTDVDPPIDLRRFLPNMILFGVEPGDGGDRQFRYRIQGTGITSRSGHDITGKTIDEAFPDGEMEADKRLYDEVIAHRCCYFGRRSSPISRLKPFESYERLVMPLATADRRDIGFIWVFLVFVDGPPSRT